jgi:hypothetical protein
MKGFSYELWPAAVQNRTVRRPLALTLPEHHIMKAFPSKLGYGDVNKFVQPESHLHPPGCNTICGRSSFRVRIQCHKDHAPGVAV